MNCKPDYIDVDRTVIQPSPLRIRNILTLEERVRAIQAYDCRPMYTKVAKMFNCSWEQIKNIITNREAILKFYEATKNTEKPIDPNLDDIRQSKIVFLGECLYEYIQRAQLYQKTDLTEDLLRSKALEFRDLIQIDLFTPNKAWINHFKATYNFSLSNRQIMLTRIPPSSMDLKDIMMYCSKNKSKVERAKNMTSVPNVYKNKLKIFTPKKNEDINIDLSKKRQRKINFLETALYEYIQRIQYHHNISLSEELLNKIACDLRDLLKIDHFNPNKKWFTNFEIRFNLNISAGVSTAKSSPTPPITLDLRDILSYCSRFEKYGESHKSTSNTSNQKSFQQSISYPLFTLNHNIIQSDSDESNASVYELENEDQDIKPNIANINITQCSNEEHFVPPLKIKKIETNCDSNSSPIHSLIPQSNELELPIRVRNYNDALKLIHPLEEFAMLEENYRAIGILSQLEEIFKNPPKKDDFESTELSNLS